VRHEHSKRRRLLQPAPDARAAAADGAATSGQLRALQRRVTEMLPGKLRSRLAAGGAAVPALELASLGQHGAEELGAMLRAALGECAWSATPQLDGVASREMSLSLWHHFLRWCARVALSICRCKVMAIDICS
jgi:hypothetical protein